VDNLSSAHVYLRVPIGPLRKKYRDTGSLDHIAEAVEDCVQLVKENSIEGCKKASVDVVFTEWENLRKTGDMADGQVGFHDRKKVVTIRNVTKNREVLNRTNKTKREEFPDLEKERQDRDAKLAAIRKKRAKERALQEKQEKERQKAEKEARDYKHMFKEEDMTTNDSFAATDDASAAVEYEDNFF